MNGYNEFEYQFFNFKNQHFTNCRTDPLALFPPIRSDNRPLLEGRLLVDLNREPLTVRQQHSGG